MDQVVNIHAPYTYISGLRYGPGGKLNTHVPNTYISGLQYGPGSKQPFPLHLDQWFTV